MSPLAKGGRIPLWTGLDKTLVTDVLKANAEGAIDLDSMNAYLSIDNTQGITSVSSGIDSQLSDVYKEEFEAMCYGRQTVEETINNMVTRCNQLLADNK